MRFLSTDTRLFDSSPATVNRSAECRTRLVFIFRAFLDGCQNVRVFHCVCITNRVCVFTIILIINYLFTYGVEWYTNVLRHTQTTGRTRKIHSANSNKRRCGLFVIFYDVVFFFFFVLFSLRFFRTTRKKKKKF